MKFELLLLLAVVATAKAVRYDGYQVYQVGPLETDTNLEIMKGLVDNDERLKQIILFDDGISMISPITVAVAPETVKKFLEVLSQFSIRYTLVNRDIQKSFDRTMEENRKALEENARVGEIFPHNAYLRYAQQVKLLNDLADASPIANIFYYGSSYEQRPMAGIAINGPNINIYPAIYIDANTHAREWITSATALYIIDKILTDNSSDAVYLRENFRFYIFPNVNPDGYEHSWDTDRMWRKTRSYNVENSTCKGTDPNRNWDSNWGGEGSSPDPCSDTYHGSRPFSEYETQITSSFLDAIKKYTNVMISLHAYSQVWLVPWGGNTTKPDDYDELMRVGNAAAAAIQSVNGKVFQVGTPPDTGSVAAGCQMDWAKETNGMVYGYSPELRPATDLEGGFDIPPSNIIPSGEEILAGLAAVAREAIHKQPDPQDHEPGHRLFQGST